MTFTSLRVILSKGLMIQTVTRTSTHAAKTKSMDTSQICTSPPMCCLIKTYVFIHRSFVAYDLTEDKTPVTLDMVYRKEALTIAGKYSRTEENISRHIGAFMIDVARFYLYAASSNTAAEAGETKMSKADRES